MSKLVLNIFTGPMFAGKTTRLIEYYNSLNVENELEKLAFKFNKDNRYEEECDTKDYLKRKMIYSHDKKKILSIPISSCKEIINNIRIIQDTYNVNIKYLFIDEGQFFPQVNTWFEEMKNIKLDTSHPEHKYLKSLKEITISGLDYDASGNIFNPQFYSLSNQADYLLVAISKCYKCGDNAQYTIILNDETKKEMEGNVLVGDDSIYQPACKKHTNFNVE